MGPLVTYNTNMNEETEIGNTENGMIGSGLKLNGSLCFYFMLKTTKTLPQYIDWLTMSPYVTRKNALHVLKLCFRTYFTLPK